jgi:oligopeptidase A
VAAFLRDLSSRARPFAQRDYAELVAFARSDLGLAELAAWDLAFASEKLKADRVRLLRTGRAPVLSRRPGSRWSVPRHRDDLRRAHTRIQRAEMASVGAVLRNHRRPGRVGRQFYLDLHARENKQDGAWMDDAINRRRSGTSVQHPVAYMTCNLSPPVGGRPATFTHDEVITLFHEFGHGLHLLLTRVDTAGVSGIQGVEWDAVELPSQFMENFCWEWEVLSHMTRHVETGLPLPRSLFDKMLAAKNFQSGMATVRQLEAGLFDMLLHAEFDPVARTPWPSPQALLEAVQREVAVVPRAAHDRLLLSFSHIFAGGYAAGYYSYKWAEVLAADAYSLFEESGVLSPSVGARFLDEILARGGSRPAMESFVAFRGRPPQLDAFLRHNGMTVSS